MNINKVFIAGNLTRDPAIRFLPNEKVVGEIGIAINRKWKDSTGVQKEETTFVDCECFGRTAELAGQYLQKGSGCFIEGRLRLDTWDDKATGQKRSKMKVVIDSLQFTDGKPHGERAPAAEQAESQPSRPSRPAAPAPAAGDDEPPF
jgi:single-strand DNA-binding protein